MTSCRYCSERVCEHPRRLLSEVRVSDPLRVPSVRGPHDPRTPQHNHYFHNILTTVSGLGYELTRLKQLLSSVNGVGSTLDSNLNSPQLPSNELNYLGTAAKSLLELILSLKRELTVQIKVESNCSFDRVLCTNEIVRDLEVKVKHLLEKLNRVKSEFASTRCCKGCPENAVRVNRSRPWKTISLFENGQGEPHDQEHLLNNNDYDDCFLKNKRPLLLRSSCRINNIRFEHSTNKQLGQFNARTLQSNIHSLPVLPILIPKINLQSYKKRHEHFQENNVKYIPNINEYIGKSNENNRRNKAKDFETNFLHQQTNKSQQRLKTSSPIELATFRRTNPGESNNTARKRAGKDNSIVYVRTKPDLLINKKRVDSERDKSATHNYIPGRSSQNYRPNTHKNTWLRQDSFYSTSEEEASGVEDNDASDLSSLTDSESSASNIEKNQIRSRRKDYNNLAKAFIFTNRKHNKKMYPNPNTKMNRKKFGLIASEAYLKVSDTNSSFSSDFDIEKKLLPTKSKNKGKNKRRSKPYGFLKRSNRMKSKPRFIIEEEYTRKVGRKNCNINGTCMKNTRRYKKNHTRPKQNEAKRKEFKINSGNRSNIGIDKKYYSKNNHWSKDDKKSPKAKIIKYDRYYETEDLNCGFVLRSRDRKQRRTNQKRRRTQLSDASVTDHKQRDTYSSSSSEAQVYLDNGLYTGNTDDSYPIGNDYNQYFEKVSDSNDYACDESPDPGNQLELGLGGEPTCPQPCDMCPPPPGPQCCDLTPSADDEYEAIFEKIVTPKKIRRPKKLKCKKPIVLIEDDKAFTDDSTLSAVTECSSSSTISLILEEPKVRPLRRRVRKKKFRSLKVVEKDFPPTDEGILYYRKHKKHRKYIRVGSQKFQEVAKKEIDHDLNNSIEEKNTRGTSTEILPLHAKKTSTSDLIKLIKVIGTNTEQVYTRETGIDPIPQKQKTSIAKTTVISKLTNTDAINTQTTGTETILEKPKPLFVSKGNDPLFIAVQTDKVTNTEPEKKKYLVDSKTDPRPTEKIQHASKATDTLQTKQEVKFTNTETTITYNKQTETNRRPDYVSIGLSTTQANNIQDQQTSCEKVNTFSRGNDPIAIKMSNKQLQTKVVERKPAVKSRHTETFTLPRFEKITQTKFAEETETKPPVYGVQKQTKKIKENPPPSILRIPKSFSEELALIELDDPLTLNELQSSPSELSMRLTFKKCHEDVYKRRPKNCKPWRTSVCGKDHRVLVCERKRSKIIRLNSIPNCTVVKTIQKGNLLDSEFQENSRSTKFPSDHVVNTRKATVSPVHKKVPKLRQECQLSDEKSPKDKQLNTMSRKGEHKELAKSKSNDDAVFLGSSDTTLTSCDWKNIAEKVKAYDYHYPFK